MGSLVQKVTADGKRWQYAWDLAGQLVEVTRPDGQAVRFAYDALGRRVRKTFAGRTTRFVWDGNDLVHELANASEAVTWVFEPGTFAPLAKMEGGKRYGVVVDHLGTPKMMADEAGALAWKAQLDVYGVARNDVALTGCPWRWPGQYEDEETGLFYNRFRYYDPEAGRYVCQDPIGLKGGLGPYRYVRNPLSWLDPLGLAGAPGTCGDLLEKAIEARLNAEGIPIVSRNQKIFDATGREIGEIDFETAEAIIEATVSSKGKLGQVTDYLSPALNPTGKVVILYAETYGGRATAAVEDAGGLVVKKMDDLVALVKSAMGRSIQIFFDEVVAESDFADFVHEMGGYFANNGEIVGFAEGSATVWVYGATSGLAGNFERIEDEIARLGAPPKAGIVLALSHDGDSGALALRVGHALITRWRGRALLAIGSAVTSEDRHGTDECRGCRALLPRVSSTGTEARRCPGAVRCSARRP